MGSARGCVESRNGWIIAARSRNGAPFRGSRALVLSCRLSSGITSPQPASRQDRDTRDARVSRCSTPLLGHNISPSEACRAPPLLRRAWSKSPADGCCPRAARRRCGLDALRDRDRDAAQRRCGLRATWITGAAAGGACEAAGGAQCRAVKGSLEATRRSLRSLSCFAALVSRSCLDEVLTMVTRAGGSTGIVDPLWPEGLYTLCGRRVFTPSVAGGSF